MNLLGESKRGVQNPKNSQSLLYRSIEMDWFFCKRTVNFRDKTNYYQFLQIYQVLRRNGDVFGEDDNFVTIG